MRAVNYVFPIFLCAALLLLCGCQGYPGSRTALLPDSGDGETAAQPSDGDGYQLQKIYTYDFVSCFSFGCFASIADCEDNQIELFLAGRDGYERRLVDYRYGFYEELELFCDYGGDDASDDTAVREAAEPEETPDLFVRMYSYYEDSALGVGTTLRLCDEILSPDGKYSLSIDTESGEFGAKLYLVSLADGKTRLLLDGDVDGYDWTEYQFATAWSRDGSTLCYGYFAREGMTEEAGADGCCYIMDVEDGGVLLDTLYYRSEAIWMRESGRLYDFYVERSGSSLMVAVVMQWNEDPDYNYVDVFYWDMEDGEALKSSMMSTCYGDSPLVLLPETGYCYLVQNDALQIVGLDVKNDRAEAILTADDFVLEMICLDDGKTFVTAEAMDGYRYDETICLYRCGEEGVAKQTLYLDAYYVRRFQYDADNRRLLAETDNASDDMETAMIFTFGEE